MDAKMLEAFITLYERKSIRQAADQLFISPQGLSHLLQNMENELDVSLFIRTVKGLEPTVAGEYLYQQVGSLLQNYRQLTQNIRRVGGRRKELSFVCSYGVMSALPYELLLEFQKQNPSYKVKWKEYPDRQAEQFLQEDQFELGLFVLGNQRFDSSFHVTPLFTRKIVLLVYRGHPLYCRDSINFRELKDEPIIMEGDDFWMFDLFRQKCISNGFFPNIIAETGDISFCHKLCSMEQGLGVSVDFVADFIQTPNIRKVYFDDPEFFWPVGLVWHKNTTLSEAGRTFSQFLQVQFGVQ